MQIVHIEVTQQVSIRVEVDADAHIGRHRLVDSLRHIQVQVIHQINEFLAGPVAAQSRVPGFFLSYR